MDDWRSYDGVAETYERVHAPRLRGGGSRPAGVGGRARGRARPGRGHRDRRGRADRRGRRARAVGIDESPACFGWPGGCVPRWGWRPQKPSTFRSPTASSTPSWGTSCWRISPRYQTALFDIIRVMRPGGRVAFSSWSDGVDAYQEAWREMVESVVPREMLAPGLRRGRARAREVPPPRGRGGGADRRRSAPQSRRPASEATLAMPRALTLTVLNDNPPVVKSIAAPTAREPLDLGPSSLDLQLRRPAARTNW